mmetsp:Transcript_41860/g.77849  ORF Transcript_41860/g.77849 Transcript_41860/m.77849 type:complete len:111 (-) Transcript_41860:43-375(-)
MPHHSDSMAETKVEDSVVVAVAAVTSRTGNQAIEEGPATISSKGHLLCLCLSLLKAWVCRPTRRSLSSLQAIRQWIRTITSSSPPPPVYFCRPLEELGDCWRTTGSPPDF